MTQNQNILATKDVINNDDDATAKWQTKNLVGLNNKTGLYT